MADARALADALRWPERLAALDAAGWNGLLRMARGESLLGQLAARVEQAGIALPPRVATLFADHAVAVETSQRGARWEARMTAAALAGTGSPVVLLKGAAYVAAGLSAAAGRTVGDLDILVPRACLDAVETALLAAGWGPLKDDPYDDTYYRRWMHELPPLVHEARGTLVDVHHTILPLTARRRPDAAALIADAVPAGGGLSVLSPPDMLLHSVAHAFADGEFDGGVRNLWDIHRLIGDFAAPAFWPRLAERAALHDLAAPLATALRLSRELFGTGVDAALAGQPSPWDAAIRRRLLARDRWGYPIRPRLRRAFYVRGHLLRMPLPLLTRHLWTKWRMARRDARPPLPGPPG